MPESPAAGVALITGGAIRVGRAISIALARRGYSVAVNYHRSRDAAEQLVGTVSEFGGSAAAYRADITDASAAAELVESVESGLGPISLLVNNAAVFERRPFLELDDETWARHRALNLDAPFRLCRTVGGRMWARGAGRIVNICGTVGIQPAGDYVHYRVAKSGLDALTRSLAEALAPRVQVNGVAPGAILFPDDMPEQDRREVLARVPAGHIGSPEDVASAVVFFAGAPAYVTGTILPVDGGASLVTG